MWFKLEREVIREQQYGLVKHGNFTWWDVETMPTIERMWFYKHLSDDNDREQNIIDRASAGPRIGGR